MDSGNSTDFSSRTDTSMNGISADGDTAEGMMGADTISTMDE